MILEKFPGGYFRENNMPYYGKPTKLYSKGVLKMEKDIKQMLDEEIRDEITNLNALEPGTEEHSKAADTVAKLYKLKVEDDKIDKETSEQVKNRYLKYGLEAAGIIVPLIFYGIWMNKGFKFEETGTFTSSTFRGLFNRFRPTK